MTTPPTTDELAEMTPKERVASLWAVTVTDWEDITDQGRAVIAELADAAD